jgi:hypothetical protein
MFAAREHFDAGGLVGEQTGVDGGEHIETGERYLRTAGKHRGIIMPRPQLHNDTLAPAVVPGHPHTRYIVVRQDDVWFIKFDGDEYGPYKTDREAMLFAIDAAHNLGNSGEDTQVLLMDENGNLLAAWTHGKDPYPPGD